MKQIIKLASLFTALCIVFSLVSLTSPVSAAEVKLTATKADEWTDLFYRTSQSERTWLGADGIYSVSLDGNDAFASANGNTNTFFIFSDTLMGTSDANGKHTGQWGMPSHTSALLSGSTPDKDNISFVYGNGGNMRHDENLFGKKRWMLDCLVINDKLYVFGFPEQDWKPTQIDLFTLPIENGTVNYERYTKTEKISQLCYRDGNTALYAYGIGIMCNTVSAGAPNPDGYIYIYGYRDAINEWSRKDLIVSRIKETDFPDFSKLTYWDGQNWVTDIKKSAPVLRSVSCEMSVTPITTGPYKGKYIAVYTKNTEGAEVAYSISDTPYSGFSSGVTFYNCPEYRTTSADGKGWLYTYNAKAHPHLSEGDKLLVSYNCNARDCNTQHPSDYHPRFLWLDLDPNNEGSGDVSSEVSSNVSSVKPPVSSEVSSVKPPVQSDASSDVSSVISSAVSSESSSEASSDTVTDISSSETQTEISSSEESITDISSDTAFISSEASSNVPPSDDVGESDYLWLLCLIIGLVVGAGAVLFINKLKT